jgi:hypothetical protein
MGFSFSMDLGDAVSRVRMHIGDATDAGHDIEDETIEALIAAGKTELQAAAQLARSLASKYARQIDSGVDGAYQRNAQVFAHFQALANDLDRQARAETVADGSSGFSGVQAFGVTSTEVTDARADESAATNAPLRWS